MDDELESFFIVISFFYPGLPVSSGKYRKQSSQWLSAPVCSFLHQLKQRTFTYLQMTLELNSLSRTEYLEAEGVKSHTTRKEI